MGNMRFNVGDHVRIKSLDWYNKNKSKSHGTVACGGKYFDYDMREWCGKTMTIFEVYQTCYLMEEDGFKYLWTDEMIEGLVEEETKPKYEDEVNGEYHSTPKYLVRPSGYQFVDENGNVINATKIVLEKKKKVYPKTYVECSDILSVYTDPDISGYKGELLWTFQKLLICRDAYWKIAGEEMGLGKPWEPDWNNIHDKYCIYFVSGDVWLKECQTRQCFFAFPTAEMRDAFYENFKKEIEICKELL